ncbi:MAG: hypothetical protein M0D53_01345 [Flavobacterium sp. JAD_PAG50586_2]|nr:MAG: hypothetical protein M0D53_01345 [Flavobacterium sp. JAD_PAG50586_2]
MVFSKRGSGYVIKKRYKDAISDFNKALEGYRKDQFKRGEFFTYNKISDCYREMNAMEEAAGYILKIINHPEFNAMPWTNKALMYDKLAFIYLKTRKYPKALEYFKTAQAHCPSNNLNLMKQIKANTAMALFFLHRTGEAQATAEEVIGDGNNMNAYRQRDAYYVVGLCYFEKKDFIKAKDRLTTAIITATRIDSAGAGNAHNFDVLADAKKRSALWNFKTIIRRNPIHCWKRVIRKSKRN